MGVAKTDRFGVLRLGRRTALRMMVLTIAGLMSLGAVTPAYADEPPASFWTQFTPSSDTRLIFVSSSEGHDANSGLTPAQPVKTLAKAESLLRDGFPDWMLLKRGDVWETGMPFWSKGGRSPAERMVVGAYGTGTERPQLRPPGSSGGLQAQGNSDTSHIAFVGLHLEPRSRQDDQMPWGVTWFRRGNDILFEDLYVAGFAGNFNLQSLSPAAPVNNIRINGCVIVDAWSKTSHSQGLFTSGVDGLVIENSVIASNGFSAVRGAAPTIFNHNLYIDNGAKNVIVRNNIIADASSHGVQMRPGGIVDDNLFIYNPLAATLGGGTHPNEGGVTGSVQRNVVLHGKSIGASLPRSFGILAINIRQAVIKDNIISVSEIGHNGTPLGTQSEGSYGITDLLISSNTIVNWNGSLSLNPPLDGHVFDRIVLEHNRIYADLTPNPSNSSFNKPMASVFAASHPGITLRQNSYSFYGMHSRPFTVGSWTTAYSTDRWQNEVEPDATISELSMPPSGLKIDRYLDSLGLSGSVDEFLAMSRQMSRASLDPRFTAKSVRIWAIGVLPR